MRAIVALFVLYVGLVGLLLWQRVDPSQRTLADAPVGAARAGNPQAGLDRRPPERPRMVPAAPLLVMREPVVPPGPGAVRPAAPSMTEPRVTAQPPLTPQSALSVTVHDADAMPKSRSPVRSQFTAPGRHTVVTTLRTPLFVEARNASSAALDFGLPTAPRTEGGLAGMLQRELRRVGCYLGEVDGIWGAGSRRAMTAFNERVNAVLPVEQPDTILLRLVSAHVGTVCGSACPRGQAFAPDGRCMPTAILAWTSRPEGSVGVGPRPETAAGTTAARATWTTRLTAAQGPAYEPTSSTMKPAPFAPPRPGFDGRMAVGGPNAGLPARPGPASAEEQRAREVRAPRRPPRSQRVDAGRFSSATRSTRWTATFFGNP
jgi:hypothetical protein